MGRTMSVSPPVFLYTMPTCKRPGKADQFDRNHAQLGGFAGPASEHVAEHGAGWILGAAQ